MKKYGWKIVGLFILAGLLFFWLIRAPVLSIYLSDKMGIDLSVRWVGLFPHHSKIHGLKIENPRGFKKSAFEAKEVVCRYHMGDLFAETTVFDLIEIDHSVLMIDFSSPYHIENNWT